MELSVCVVSLFSLCIWQVQVSVYCARRIPVHLRCTQFQSCCTLSRSASSNLYLSVADIANPDLLACASGTWISLDIDRFYEEHCQPSCGSSARSTSCIVPSHRLHLKPSATHKSPRTPLHRL